MYAKKTCRYHADGLPHGYIVMLIRSIFYCNFCCSLSKVFYFTITSITYEKVKCKYSLFKISQSFSDYEVEEILLMINKLISVYSSQAEEERLREYKAAVKVQAWFRASRSRSYLK